ncbi:MAG: four helix bundle protein [Patescibacteria group bacterium]
MDIAKMRKSNIIRDKSFQFAVRTIKLAQDLAQHREYVLSKQFMKSATSIGANVEEGLQGQSRPDFISKMSIALKEAYEARYWLRLMHTANLGKPDVVIELGRESSELILILSSIIKTTKVGKQK